MTQPPPWPSAPAPTWSSAPAPAPGWGPPPDGVTPGWPAPRKPPGNAGWIVALVLTVVAVIGIAIVGVVVAVVVSTKPPIDATNKVLGQVQRGEYAAAYRNSCSANQIAYSPAEFRRTWESGIAARGRIKSYDVSGVRGHGTASHKVVDTTIDFAGGSSISFDTNVYKEHGTWRPCLLSNP